MIGRIALSKIVWGTVPTIALVLLYIALYCGMSDGLQHFHGYKVWVMTLLAILPLLGYYLNLYEMWRVDIECINYDQPKFWLALGKTLCVTLILAGITYFGGVTLSYM